MLVSHKVNPLIVPPVDLCNILVKVKHDMRTNPTLEEADDPDRNIWACFSIMKWTPVVMDDFLLVILTIHRSLHMDLYKVHNLPALHQDLGAQFSYVMQGQYLVISKHELYVTVPKDHDIRICMATEGYLCNLKQDLYPIETLEWCVYALYISDRSRINKHCN